MKINRTKQQIPVEVQWDSIVQLLKTVDFLKTAAGSVRLFCPASACPCGSEAQGVLVFNRKKDNLILQLRSL